MSELRRHLRLVRLEKCKLDWNLVRAWDIPLDEHVTADEASIWLNGQILDDDDIYSTCTNEGLSAQEWDDAVEFTLRCLRKGVIPHEYVRLLIDRQDCINKLIEELGW